MAQLKLRNLSVPLWVRLGTPIALIIALTIALISFLNYYNFEKTYRDLNVLRIDVVARDLRQAIEAGLNVGLEPKNNTQLEKAISAAKDRTEGLRFAFVVNENGERLVKNGESAPLQDWKKRLTGKEWLGEDVDTYQVGLPYRNSFGVVVGAVILGYDKASIDRATSTMRFNLFADWLRAVAVLSLVTLSGVWWVTRRLEEELGEAECALGRSLSEEEVADLHLPVLGEDIERGIPAFIRQSRTIAKSLAIAPMKQSS
jgi:hypothetical protein